MTDNPGRLDEAPLPELDIDPDVAGLLAELDSLLSTSALDYGDAVTALRNEALNKMVSGEATDSPLDKLKLSLATTMEVVIGYQTSRGLVSSTRLAPLIETANNVLLDLIHSLSSDREEPLNYDQVSAAVTTTLDESLASTAEHPKVEDRPPTIYDDDQVPTRISWKLQANCKGQDLSLFYPERGASQRLAKEMCSACVVRIDCLNYALNNNEPFGIWGGENESARERMMKGRNK